MDLRLDVPRLTRTGTVIWTPILAEEMASPDELPRSTSPSNGVRLGANWVELLAWPLSRDVTVIVFSELSLLLRVTRPEALLILAAPALLTENETSPGSANTLLANKIDGGHRLPSANVTPNVGWNVLPTLPDSVDGKFSPTILVTLTMLSKTVMTSGLVRIRLEYVATILTDPIGSPNFFDTTFFPDGPPTDTVELDEVLVPTIYTLYAVTVLSSTRYVSPFDKVMVNLRYNCP
jgi:hypothetical protein